MKIVIILMCIIFLAGCSGTLNHLIPGTVVKDENGKDVFCWRSDPYYEECQAMKYARGAPYVGRIYIPAPQYNPYGRYVPSVKGW